MNNDLYKSFFLEVGFVCKNQNDPEREWRKYQHLTIGPAVWELINYLQEHPRDSWDNLPHKVTKVKDIY